MPSKHDSLYAQPIEAIKEFCFDEKVAAVFDDMITRSVPGYRTILGAIGLLSEQYGQNNSFCYDLGCSLGASAMAMANKLNASNCRVIAVDHSLAMIQRCGKILKKSRFKVPIQAICADVRDVRIQTASVVVLNFTLQFIEPDDRLEFLRHIHSGLLTGGILVLSEKLCFNDPRQQILHERMHHAFKKNQGYSNLEISQKRTALENILIPDTAGQHRDRLKMAGFESVDTWFQYFNFVSIIAFK